MKRAVRRWIAAERPAVYGNGLVIDASIAVKWFRKDEAGHERAIGIMAEQVAGRLNLHAPDLLFPEVTNVLKSKRDMSESAVLEALETMDRLACTIHVTSPDLTAAAIRLAFSHRLTVYDAMYVAVVERTGARMVTADHEILREFRSGGRAVALADWEPPPQVRL